MGKQLYDFESSTFKSLRIFPGIVTIAFILSPFILAAVGKPQYLAYYVLILSVYWVYKTFTFIYGFFVGYNRYLRDSKVDWRARLMQLKKRWDKLPTPATLPPTWEDFYMAVIIPTYKEPKEILIRTLDSLANSNFPVKEKLFVILAVEERAGPKQQEVVRQLIERFKFHFKDIMFFVHPKNIPGEVIGIAGPNLKWAARGFVEYLDKKNISPRNVLMLKIDADTRLSSQLLAALSYRYLTHPKRYNRFFTNALKLYSNNFWKAPLLTRLFSAMLSLVLLSEWITNKHKKQCFSSYAFNLDVLVKIGYWDPKIGVDDTGFFWQAFLYLNGDYRGEEVYLPSYMDAVDVGDYIRSHIALYKQQVRWGGGAIVTPMGLQGMLNNKKIPLREKIFKTLHLFEVYTFWTTIAYFLGLALPLLSFVVPSVDFYAYSHIAPYIVSKLLTFTLIFVLPIEYYVLKLYGPMPKDYSLVKKVIFFLSFFAIVINIYLFNLIPYLKAQIDIMLGRFGKFYVVEKTAASG